MALLSHSLRGDVTLARLVSPVQDNSPGPALIGVEEASVPGLSALLNYNKAPRVLSIEPMAP